MSEDTSQKITGERSPRFPSDTLAKCIEYADKVFSQLGRSAVPTEALAKALGYTSLSGASRSSMASVAYYGLSERGGNNYKVSDLALRIIRPISPADKALAVRQAAQEPKVFAQIFQEHADCSESVLSSILLHKGFTEDGANRAAKIFRDNLEFIKQFGDTPIQPKGEPAKNTSPEAASRSNTPIHSPSPMIHAITANELPVPIGENLIARVPFPMSEEDFTLLLGTLNLWKHKLVKNPSAPSSPNPIGDASQ